MSSDSVFTTFGHVFLGAYANTANRGHYLCQVEEKK